MKTITSSYWLIVLIELCYLSCTKDKDRKLLGTYKGTARHTIGDANNLVRDRDTLYTDVVITVSESTESTRKKTLLTLTFMPSAITPAYNENMSVDNGVVDFMRTNRGAVGTAYIWKGSIYSDSLKLTNRNQESNGIIWQWDFKAQRQ